jgi:TonB family protein
VAAGISLGAHLALVTVVAVVLPRVMPAHDGESRETIDLVNVDIAPADSAPAALDLPRETLSPAHATGARNPSRPRSLLHASASAAPRIRGQKQSPEEASASPGNLVATVAPAAEPARFVLSSETAIVRREENGLPGSAGPSARDNNGGESVLSEHAADQPTRVLSKPAFPYPLAARQAEVEADVELEIVVGKDGRVLTARALSHPGYGLEQAAARGVLAYQFSPARRSGHPVTVRRKWVMEFRLR